MHDLWSQVRLVWAILALIPARRKAGAGDTIIVVGSMNSVEWTGVWNGLLDWRTGLLDWITGVCACARRRLSREIVARGDGTSVYSNTMFSGTIPLCWEKRLRLLRGRSTHG